jgi:hypothetical protein
VLLENLFSIPTGRVMATELRLPAGATVPLDTNGTRWAVTGRIDAVFLDQSDWLGAEVAVVDFKTGGDSLLSAERMAKKGASLQLGIYLAAAHSLGAKTGRVWMVKPVAGGVASMGMDELALALAPLATIACQLATGRYGALTPDRSTHAAGGFDWPLACVPVPAAVLAKKFAATFGVDSSEAEPSDE